MSKQTKYALFSYDTENIGDEIQSIAASRFLPRINYYINRDNINSLKIGKNETVKIIMNGWCFAHKTPLSRSYDWPPHNSNLDPLLISMHFRQDDKKLIKMLSSKESIEYFKKHGPVGARDIATLSFLKSLDIPAYFSGCLTLTLLPSPAIKKQDYVLAIDVDDRIIQTIQSRTNRPIINLSVYRPVNFTTREKHLFAQYWLYLYQSAHCVVTRRLHAILPSLALGTPVIAIEQDSDRGRYEGLIDLANHYSAKEFIENSDISVEQPLNNPPHFKKLRDQLISTCSSFTGYDSKAPSFSAKNIDEFIQSPEFINTFTKLARNAYLSELDNVDFIKDHIGIKRSITNTQKLIYSTSKKLIKHAIGLDKH